MNINIDYKKYDADVERIEKKYSYKSDDIYYFNVHRPKKLILGLQNRIELFDYKLIPSIFKHIGEEVDAFEVMPKKGTGHVIVDVQTKSGRKYVLRANILLQDPEYYMSLEPLFISNFKSIGIPTTNLHYVDTTRKEYPFDIQIMDRLPGKNLGDEWDGTQSQYEAIAYNFGRNVAKTYQLPFKGWGRIKPTNTNTLVGAKTNLVHFLTTYLQHDLEFLALFKFCSLDDCDKIWAYFNSKDIISLFSDTNQGYLIHNDPSDLNMRYIGDNIVSVFDWENAVIYDPINELGIAPTWSCHYPKEEYIVRGFVDELGYEPDNLKQKMAVYYFRKMIDKVQFALRGERLAQKHCDYFSLGAKNNGLDIPILSY